MRKETMIKKYGHTFCEVCLKVGQIEDHHIVFRSEAPKHRNLNHEDNHCCSCVKKPSCNDFFHGRDQLNLSKNQRREKIVKKRRLWELFPELPYLKYE